MREIRLSGSEGGGIEFNRFSLPLSKVLRTAIPIRAAVSDAAAKHLGKSPGYVTKDVGTPAIDHSGLSGPRGPLPGLIRNS